MKTRSSSKSSRRGNVLFVTLVIGGTIAVALCGYLNVIATQNNFAVRSQVWNLCMPVVEAGLEEALSHINNPGTTNFATQGWTWDATSQVFTNRRVIGDSYYTVTIQTNLTNGPIIISTGYVPAPVTIGTGQNSFLASAVPAPGVSYISRKVQLTTRHDPLIGKALVVKNSIDFNGNNVMVDSYDSSIGVYDTGSNRGDKGDVTTDNDVVGNVSTGNADIWGHLSVGPKATLKFGPNTVIGSAAWHGGGNKGAQSGWLKKDASVLMPDVRAPWTQGSYSPPPPQGSYKYELDGGSYEIAGDWNLSSTDKMFVKGSSVVWVRGNVQFDAGALAKVTSGGQGLTMYVSGSINFSGDWDKSSLPSDLMVFGLPSCKTITVATGSHLEAVIYAPEADMSLTGNAQFSGGVVANSMRMNGSTGFHYDVSLGNYPAYRAYVITSWKEI